MRPGGNMLVGGSFTAVSRTARSIGGSFPRQRGGRLQPGASQRRRHGQHRDPAKPKFPCTPGDAARRPDAGRRGIHEHQGGGAQRPGPAEQRHDARLGIQSGSQWHGVCRRPAGGRPDRAGGTIHVRRGVACGNVRGSIRTAVSIQFFRGHQRSGLRDRDAAEWPGRDLRVFRNR